MFPKGPRFDPVKVSDVPGPNAYNLNTEPLDDYKRGAFLEKAERFSKEKLTQAPGPACDQKKPPKQAVPTSKSQQSLCDRYAVLQRKVEDLERVHNDSKKLYQTELDCLKCELARSQKANADQADKLDKQKKTTDVLDARIQDFKKAAAADQVEIKDLRVRLRMSEHERTQLATKLGEAGDLKKSLQSLEIKRREELKERDKRISELEKAVGAEKKNTQAAESKSQQAQEKGSEELQAARAAARSLEALVNESQTGMRKAENALNMLKEESTGKETELLVQLKFYREVIGRIAEEYGRLASSSVPAESHKLLKHQHTASQFQVLRLERKLANSEGQVVELAHLIRQTKEKYTTLLRALQETENDMSFYIAALQDATSALRSANSDIFLLKLSHATTADLVTFRHEFLGVHERNLTLTSDLYHLTCSDLLFEYSAVEKHLLEERLISQQHAASLADTLASHETIAARLETIQNERTAVDEQLRATTKLADVFKSSAESMTRKVEGMEKKMDEVVTSSEAVVKKEREVVWRLNGAVQKSRMAEDALRGEIEQLTNDLMDAARYQEAYYSLSDEVGALVARNQLAEEEAQRLSKFNAEILSHNNPAQRIMYVDRVRRELAETKHKLVMLTREQETVLAANEDLQHELGMYKSVMVPVDQKPRTNMIRVERPPLLNLGRSLNVDAGPGTLGKSGITAHVKGTVERTPVLEIIPGDMTIEEIS